MRTNKKTWIVFILLSIISIILWIRVSYPEFSFINLSISKKSALKIAKEYITKKEGIDPSKYQTAIILDSKIDTDRFLQKTLGFKKEIIFINEHKIDLFRWLIRFFREKEKEEFFVSISSKTGEVLSFYHTIKDTDKRDKANMEESQALARNFLKKTFQINFNQYILKEKLAKKHDNRTDYSFIWKKKNVQIPWSDAQNSGTAKLVTKVTTSGKDILYFSKNALTIPDQFSRKIESSKQSGRILTGIFIFLYYALFSTAIFFVLTQRNYLAMHITKNFYIGIAVFVVFLMIIFNFNNLQDLLFGYNTQSTFKIYFSGLTLHFTIAALFLGMTLSIPGLAGESLHEQDINRKKEGGFLYYITSTFLSRNVFRSIILGYLVALIMLGIQSFLFYLGRKYFQVWVERPQIPQLSSSIWPFLTAFIIAAKASLNEEITFRLFGINWGKRVLKNTLFACILMSVLWGFGHTHYQIFPMWFRGVEVSFLGFFLSFVYLRYGIITVVIAHYLFDAFWGCAGFILGKAPLFDFLSCLFILLLPAIWGIIAFLKNKPDTKKEVLWKFNRHQLYNMDILKSFLSSPENKENKNTEQLREELLSHGWDPAIIDKAMNEL